VSEQFLKGTSAQYRLCSAMLLKLHKSRNNFVSQTVDFTESADFSGSRPRREIRRPRKYDDYNMQFANTQHVRSIRREIVSNVDDLRFISERPCERPSYSAESRSPATYVQGRYQVSKVYKVGVDVACEQLLAKSCRDNSLRGDFGLFDQLRSPADSTLSDLIVKDRNTSSHLAITPSIHSTDITSFSVASISGFRAMARTKQTMRKTCNVKKRTGVKSTKEFACFVCSFKCTVKHNYQRHLARMHSKKEDGTHADDEYCERFANKRSAKYVQSAGTVDTDTDVEPSTPPCLLLLLLLLLLKYVRRIKEAQNKKRMVKLESHTKELSQKINFGDKACTVDASDAIEIISDDANESADETARAVANIPGIDDSISGTREILSQDMEKEPLFEVGVSAEDIFDLIGEDIHEQSLDDTPMGLGWTLNDTDRISASLVVQRPIYTNREDIWAAPVSAVGE